MKDTYSFVLTPGQYAAGVFSLAQNTVRGSVKLLVSAMSMLYVGAMVFLFLYATNGPRVPSRAVLAALAAMFVAWLPGQLLYRYLLKRRYGMSVHGTGARTLRVEEDGIRVSGGRWEVLYRWEGIERAEIRNDMLYLIFDALHGTPIPISAFESPAEAQEFAAFVNAKARAAPTAEGSSVLSEGASLPVRQEIPAGPRTPWWVATRAVAADALRVAFFRPMPVDRPSARWSSIFVAMIASLVIPVVVAVVQTGPDGEWYWYSISSALLHVPLILGAAIAVAYAIRRPEDVPRLVMAALLCSVVADLVIIPISLATGSSLSFPMGPLVWFAPVWVASALGIYASRRADGAGRRIVALTCCLLLIAVPLAETPRDRGLWHAPFKGDSDEGGSSGKMRGPADESVFYKQPDLLRQELNGVQPGRKGAINVFFVGMAGYADQDVFRKEVESVSTLMSDRFGASGHTVRLVNNRSTLLDIPIASKTALRAALGRVASVMDKDNDVLVLYLTSHGSSDHRFSLRLWPMSFEEIDPPALRGLLDDSGIRNRVVIVSACYSGGFVPALSDPNTLVITASSADRNSFGCSNDADWTYFGKAYFDVALRATHSFTKAFTAAAPEIEAREKSQGFDPSQPQIAAGGAIVGVLDRLEAQLDGNAATGSAVKGTTPVSREPDLYDRYVNAMYTAEYLAEIKAACIANMAESGPAEAVARQPGSFGGMQKSPSHWKRIVAAWDRYTQELCTRGTDPEMVRSSYEKKVRALSSREDIRLALDFIEGPGARWLKADREATRQEQLEVARKQGDLSSSLYATYLKEQDQVFSDFRKGH